MEYFELTITTYLAKDIHFTQSNEAIGQTINKAMLEDEELKQRHEANQFKHYVFSSFFPIEEDKLYKAGKVYVFRIRSLDRKFIQKIKKLLPKATQDFKVLASEAKTRRYRFITELSTITPALATVDGKHWVKEDDIMLLQKRMENNLIRKYKDFYGEELKPEQSFIQRLEILNQKPVALSYKGIKLIGNKFKISVNEDNVSQKLAFTAMAVGLLEKNSAAGMGFCMAK